jgi:5-hydroxyisourate hydrolase-like protein (transthyretin family)
VQDSINNGGTWIAATARSNAASPRDSIPTTKVVTGLVDGTSYVFRVAAITALGGSTYSAPSAPVTPTGDATALSVGSHQTIDAGDHTVLSTTLTDSTTSTSVGGVQVELLRRSGSGASWTAVNTPITGANGRATTTVSPKTNTQYEWKFAGDATHGASTSAIESITVHQVVTISLSKHHVAAGKKVHITGTVTPNEAGKTVSLQRRSHGEWVAVDSATLSSKSGYRFTVKASHAGDFTYRVKRDATTHNASGTSATRELSVT